MMSMKIMPMPNTIRPTYGKALKIIPVSGTGSGTVLKSMVALYSWLVSKVWLSARAPVSSTVLVSVWLRFSVTLYSA